MSTARATVDHLLEQLEPLDVRARAMFGEYGLYCDERFVGVICRDTLYLKVTVATDGLDEEPPYPGARPYRRVPDGTVEDPDAVQALVRGTAELLPPRR